MPSPITCPACQARPGQPCTQPTDTSRRPVTWEHSARTDAMAEVAGRYANTPTWGDEQVPQGYAGSWHIGGGVFRQRCRECPATHDTSPGQGAVMRYAGIGPHEVAEHGLEVPGINVGLMQS